MIGRFQPLRLLEVLDKYTVEFIVIGGVASNAHGSPSTTSDSVEPSSSQQSTT
jgi:hypothetical protein